jgi:hypothetical protein
VLRVGLPVVAAYATEFIYAQATPNFHAFPLFMGTKMDYKKNNMSTDREKGRGTKRAGVTRGSRNPKNVSLFSILILKLDFVLYICVINPLMFDIIFRILLLCTWVLF